MEVPTDTARIAGGSPGQLVYEYIVEGTGGAELQVNGNITVNCSQKSSLVLTEPSLLSTSPTSFT